MGLGLLLRNILYDEVLRLVLLSDVIGKCNPHRNWNTLLHGSTLICDRETGSRSKVQKQYKLRYHWHKLCPTPTASAFSKNVYIALRPRFIGEWVACDAFFQYGDQWCMRYSWYGTCRYSIKYTSLDVVKHARLGF